MPYTSRRLVKCRPDIKKVVKYDMHLRYASIISSFILKGNKGVKNLLFQKGHKGKRMAQQREREQKKKTGKLSYIQFFLLMEETQSRGLSLVVSVLRHGPGGDGCLWIVMIPDEVHHFGHRTDPQKSQSLVFLPYSMQDRGSMSTFDCRDLRMQSSESKSFASSILPASIP